ncbi:hypothetical protein LguiA_008827 [Lonicera macranthoides]
MEEQQQEGQLHFVFFPLMAPGHMIPVLYMAKLISCTSDELRSNFIKVTTTLLQEPFEKLLGELRPDCLVTDMFFPWTIRSAAKFNIPRLVFHGTSFFFMCASANEREETVNDLTLLLNQAKDSDSENYGVIFNSFFDLEPDYANHNRNVLKRKAWHIGPFSLCNKEIEDKVARGKKVIVDEHECLKWLDSQKPNSVIYICFGSVANISAAQLYEVAKGLEASGQKFIWVVRISENEEDSGTWLPHGYEKRTKAKGLIIRGWAPQMLILDHEAVGGFVTHCGWNSTLEGVCAGVPMVTWPLVAEQFYNEKLVTEVLRIGVSVGVKEWRLVPSAEIKREVVERAVKRITVGEEGEEMRRRAKELKEKAKQAIEDGGSSYNDLTALIEELSPLKSYARELN